MSELGVFRGYPLMDAGWAAAANRWPELQAALPLADERLDPGSHGDLPRWLAALESLPPAEGMDFSPGPTVTLRGAVRDTEALELALRALHPWRKGPFELFGLAIDTEWRSDWKWDRVSPALPDLSGATVLDVGCGNGYFGWRMLEAGAEQVLGVDPTVLFSMQHRAICHYLPELAPRNALLPLRLEELPAGPRFDAVFSMGVLYHRRDHSEHLQRLKSHLVPGGTLLLETLINPEDPDGLLVPESRYARMRNVWGLPGTARLCQWLEEAGFTDVRLADVTATTTDEQRSTAWMTFESLREALDPEDTTRTVEGLPAPVRAVMTARAG